MGQVYQATDTQLGRDVALKILPDAFASDPDRLARFQREAQVLASLNHPNIAQIHGIEKSGDTQALVLELVEGPTLADRIARGPIPIDEALPIAKQIAEALEAAHEAGVIHRDLKPANIKVREDGTVKVLDFGLAKALDATPTGDPSQSPTLTAAATQMGVIMGTAAYMSPEQASGGTTDKRSDIWSFGVVFYEMLTGRRLFQGKTVSHVLGAVLQLEPTWDALPLPTPQPLRRLLRRCLEKERTQRLRDIGDALTDLDEALTTPTLDTAPASAAGSAGWRQALPLALAISAVAVIITGLAMWNFRPAPMPTSPARYVLSALPSPAPVPLTRQTELAISPDGRVVAYRAVVGGEDGLYVRHLDRLEAELLVDESAGSVFMSPHGAWVGFFSSSGSDITLKKVQVSGGPALTLSPAANPPRGASWGPDDIIIFAEDSGGLSRVSASGGEPEVLTTPELPERHYWPEFLPSGRGVLFTIVRVADGETGETSDLAVLDLSTGEQRVLLQGGTHPHYVSSGHLVYSVANTLRAVRFDADRLEVVGDPIPVVEGVRSPIDGGANVDVSDTGTLVYQRGDVAGAGTRTLVWVDRAGQEEPLAAPDGERVVFASLRDGPYTLYSRAADGTGEVERLATGGAPQLPSSWSPDGTTLVIAEQHPETGWDSAVLSMDDERVSELLIQTEFSDYYPEVSPDGRWLAYASTESGQNEIYVRPFPEVNAGKWQISRDSGLFPVWGPDGRELFYVSVNDATMMVVPVDTDPTFRPGNPEVLFNASAFLLQPGPRTFDIAPDGQRFLWARQGVTPDETSTPADIIVVENWTQELLERVPIN